MARVLMSILFAFMMATICVAAETRASITADLILYNGKIVTVNQSFDIKQAIAIRGKKCSVSGK